MAEAEDTLRVPLQNYEDRFHEHLRTTEGPVRVLYMGHNPGGYPTKVKERVSEFSRDKGQNREYETHHVDLDEGVLEESEADRTKQNDAGDINYTDNYFDFTVTHHLLCGPETDDEKELAEKREEIVKETRRITKTEPIHECG